MFAIREKWDKEKLEKEVVPLVFRGIQKMPGSPGLMLYDIQAPVDSRKGYIHPKDSTLTDVSLREYGYRIV